MLLYHGSNCEIEEIDLSKCKPYKDFGQSFYLTTILAQAKEMAKKVAERFGGAPVVNVFNFDESQIGSLNIKTFDSANRDWAEFVLRNRSHGQDHPADNFDLIVGPVANDDIATLFRTYMMKIISIDELVRGLKFRKLNNQYAFRTSKAIALLTKKESI